MGDKFCGIGGNNGWAGTSWETRKATITGLLGIVPAYGPGDHLYVGPGVYRETVNLNLDGVVRRRSGSISVTHGSKIVTGVATGWDPGIAPGDWLIVPWLAYGLTASGTGCAFDGAGTLTSAGADFAAEAIGFCVNVDTRGSYLVAAAAGAPNAVTLTDVNGVGWAIGGPFDFWIPSNEGGYEIESRESDTQITLKRPWSGPSYTWSNARYTSNAAGNGYEIFRPCYLIGDETGAHTDGVGGVVRITGTDNDQSMSARHYGIRGTGRKYWVVRGFQVDTTNRDAIFLTDCTHTIVEDIRTLSPSILTTATYAHIQLLGNTDRCTVRRCMFFGGKQASGVYLSDTGPQKYACNVFENIYAACYRPFVVDDINNTTIKNCTSGMACESFLYAPAWTNAWMGVFVHDCEVHYANNIGIWSAVNGQIVVNWCNVWDNNTDAWIATLGAQCAVDAHLYSPELPILLDGYRYPTRMMPPSEWWGVSQWTGLYPANEDIYGVLRPTVVTKRSVGPQQDYYHERDTITTYASEEASLEHPDARVTQFRIPISGNPTTTTVQVYLGAAYAGIAPKLIVHQEGNTDVEATATGTTGMWEELSVVYTPNAIPLHMWVELRSDNTAGAGDYSVYWQRLRCVENV